MGHVLPLGACSSLRRSVGGRFVQMALKVLFVLMVCFCSLGGAVYYAEVVPVFSPPTAVCPPDEGCAFTIPSPAACTLVRPVPDVWIGLPGIWFGVNRARCFP